jgi:hypothetical protein
MTSAAHLQRRPADTTRKESTMIDSTKHGTHTNQKETTMKETTMKEISMTTSPMYDDAMSARPERRRAAPLRHWRALAVAGLLALAPASVVLADTFGPSKFGATGTATAVAVQAQDGTGVDILSNGTALRAQSVNGTGVQATGNTTAVSANGGQFGVFGASTSGTGVRAFSGSGTGLDASSSSGTAVKAASTGSAGTGVFSSGSHGVVAVGTGSTGIGIQAQSASNYGGTFSGGAAPILLIPATTVGAPTTGRHQVGELFVDKNGHLFYCTTSGAPGVFKQLA